MNYLKYTLTGALLLYFLLAGTGYNIAKFCCNDCADAGIEYIARHSCVDVHTNPVMHHHHFDEPETACCTAEISGSVLRNHKNANANIQENTCDISRIVLDDYSPSSYRFIAGPFFMCLSPAYLLPGFDILRSPGLNTSSTTDFHSPGPDILQGREILTLKHVLII